MKLRESVSRASLISIAVSWHLVLAARDVRGIPTSGAPGTAYGTHSTSLITKPTAPQFSDKGTDPDLREIFIGRCADYKAGKVNPTVDADEVRLKNCSHLWELFTSTFMYREACDVNMEMYQEFVDAAMVTVPINMATYWDGWDIYSTARSYANEGKRSWTLEFTLVGYLINNLKFCGQTDPPGVRYDSCPGIDECGFATGAADAFWGTASTYFGKQAKGKVHVFLNSNREGGAFQTNNSYFAEFELVNMPADDVERLDIYLVTELEELSGDNCSSPSIVTFRNMLDERNLNYMCYDQPRDVLHLLCVDGNGNPDCQLKQDVYTSPSAPPSVQTTSGAVHRFNFGAFQVVAVAMVTSFINFFCRSSLT